MRTCFLLRNFNELRLTESPGATIIIDLTGTILDWSHGAENLFGFSSEEAIGKSFVSLVIPCDRQEEERSSLDEICAQGGMTYSSVRKRKDGSLFNVLVTSKAVRGEDGEHDCIISSKVDITPLIVQRDVGVVDAKYGLLLESMPDAIVMVNPTGRIVYFSAHSERLFGYGRDELLGHPVERLLPKRFQGGHVGFRSQYFADAQPRSMGVGLELAGMRKDGGEFPVEISLSPLLTESGTLVLSAIRDITDRKQFERALHDKNVELVAAAEAKNRFLTTMSHELRTPLNGIIGFAEFMLDGKPGPLNPKQSEYMADVLASGRHLLQLINDVLDLAKVESGKMEFFPERFSLAKAISEVCAVVRPMAMKKNLEISIDVSSSADAVTLDLQKTKQIFYNLLSNAVKFSNESSKVAIRATDQGEGGLCLSVTDSGIGIKAEDVQRLFQEFEQLDSGSARRYEGTGLGLALTRRIVEVQGGSVSVDSEAGKGSTFSVTLPHALSGWST